MRLCCAALLCPSIRTSIRERGTLGSLSMAILVQHFGELLLERASQWVDRRNSKRKVELCTVTASLFLVLSNNRVASGVFTRRISVVSAPAASLSAKV
jgi:hypothetical protein